MQIYIIKCIQITHNFYNSFVFKSENAGIRAKRNRDFRKEFPLFKRIKLVFVIFSYNITEVFHFNMACIMDIRLSIETLLFVFSGVLQFQRMFFISGQDLWRFSMFERRLVKPSEILVMASVLKSKHTLLRQRNAIEYVNGSASSKV